MRNGRLLLCPLFFALCSMFVLAGCASVGELNEAVREPNQGQVSVFLNGPGRSSLDITFELAALNIMAENGTYREIMQAPASINSQAMKDRQLLLGEQFIPEGSYKKIRLVVKEASIRRKDRTARLALPPGGIELDAGFTVNRNENTSLFLNWNADASVEGGYLFKPVIIVKGAAPELSSLLIYVTNEDSGNVSVINRQTGQVVATVLVGKKPLGIAAGTRKDALRVYVVNSGSNSLSVINPTKNRAESEIPIRFGWGAEGVAVAAVTPDRELIFTANYSSNNVSVIDGTTYQELEKINVGNGPVAIAADPPVDTLINSDSLSADDVNALKTYRDRFFNVYVTNKNSKDISVIRMDASTQKSVDVSNFSVEWSPMSLGVDYARGRLYIANHDSDKLSVMDLVQFARGSRTDIISTINNVGTFGTGVTADPSLNRVYLLQEIPGDVVVIRPFDGTGTTNPVITPIIGTVAVGNLPRSLILDPEARKLYIVNRGENNVSVMDKTTRRVEQVVPVGRRPYGIAMFPR